MALILQGWVRAALGWGAREVLTRKVTFAPSLEGESAVCWVDKDMA